MSACACIGACVEPVCVGWPLCSMQHAACGLHMRPVCGSQQLLVSEFGHAESGGGDLHLHWLCFSALALLPHVTQAVTTSCDP